MHTLLFPPPLTVDEVELAALDDVLAVLVVLLGVHGDLRGGHGQRQGQNHEG